MPVDRGLFRRTILANNDGKILDTDTQTTCLVVIDNEHHHIHEGLAWTVTGSVTLDAGQVRDYVITTPDTDWLNHLRPSVFAEAEGSLQIIGTVTSTGGSSVTPVCTNQDDPHNPYSTMRLNPSVTGTSNVLYYDGFGANRVAGGVDPVHERVLKRNTKTLVRITSDAAGNEISFKIFFYEHSKNEDHT
jgi:hypothetical protein